MDSQIMSLAESEAYRQTCENIAEVGRFLAGRGWSPATSSNYSCRLDGAEDVFAITQSGKDKFNLKHSDIMLIDHSGQALYPESAKPSAETLIHTTIYSETRAGAVLHTHSVNGTMLSLKHLNQSKIEFSGYEILKGFSGNKTHEMTEVLPILKNSQDMSEFCHQLPGLFKEHPQLHGFLIAGHGLYTWGKSLSEAKRHIETFEYLFECERQWN